MPALINKMLFYGKRLGWPSMPRTRQETSTYKEWLDYKARKWWWEHLPKSTYWQTAGLNPSKSWSRQSRKKDNTKERKPHWVSYCKGFTPKFSIVPRHMYLQFSDSTHKLNSLALYRMKIGWVVAEIWLLLYWQKQLFWRHWSLMIWHISWHKSGHLD